MSEVVVQVGLEKLVEVYEPDRLVLHREDAVKPGLLRAVPLVTWATATLPQARENLH